MKLKNLRITLLCLVVLGGINSPAHAADGSQEVSAGAASIAASPLASIEGGPIAASAFFVTGSAFIVVGVVTTAGEAVHIIVQNTVNGSKAVFKTTASLARDASVAVGSGVKAVSEATGYSLVVSGKILAFIPNAVGQELLYQSKLSK